MGKKMKKVIASIDGHAPEELIICDQSSSIIEKDGRFYDTIWDMYIDEFDDEYDGPIGFFSILA